MSKVIRNKENETYPPSPEAEFAFWTFVTDSWEREGGTQQDQKEEGTPETPKPRKTLHGIPGRLHRPKPQRLARGHDPSEIESLIDELAEE